ncbi:MAG: class I SAM-dependent methyltransferase family protein [Candidatus Micrarchaeota archaeon]
MSQGRWNEDEIVVRRPKNIKCALSGILNEEQKNALVKSFDIIGDIAIVEIPDILIQKEKEIAKAIMQVHRNVHTVVKKQSPMAGEYRTRKLKIILGEKTETLHTENNVRMLLDVAKVYFSPRLSFERKRIAEEVKNGEKILALFAGVGPFPLVIAKTRKNCEIVAIELNPIAAEYLKKNIEINKTKDITAICGDVGEIVQRDYKNFADRILMPLPKDAEMFLNAAYEGAKNGAIIHFYTFADIKNPFEDAKRKIFAYLKNENVEIIFERIVRPFSPAYVQVAVDLKVKK